MRYVADILFCVFLLYLISVVLKEPRAVVHGDELFSLVLMTTIYLFFRWAFVTFPK